jgi:hypothetical protein
MRVRIALAVTITALLGTAADAGAAARPYDFDASGSQDLVVGMRDWARGGVERGAVIDIRASDSGLTARRTLIEGPADAGRGFGQYVDSGDFNGDGYADLAVAGFGGSGLLVYYGSSAGLDGSRSTRWLEAGTRVVALGTGDADGDGFTDAAVSIIPTSSADQFVNPSRVVLLRGGRDGLATEPSATYPTPADLDHIEVRDLDRDGHAELFYAHRVGPAAVCAGSPRGPGDCRELPVPGYTDDVAIGDIAGDRDLEVVFGVPELDGLDVHRYVGGELRYWYRIDRATPGVPGRKRRHGGFGGALEAGRIDGDRRDDLVVGDANYRGPGSVTILYGARRGLARRGNRVLHQDSPGVPGSNEEGDGFGGALALLDHDGDGRLDLSVGAAGEAARGDPFDAGRVTVLYGGGRAFTGDGARDLGLADLGFRRQSFTDLGAFGFILGER